MTTNEKQNKQPEAGKKELTPRQIQMRKKMVVFPLFFLAFAGCTGRLTLFCVEN